MVKDSNRKSVANPRRTRLGAEVKQPKPVPVDTASAEAVPAGGAKAA